VVREIGRRATQPPSARGGGGRAGGGGGGAPRRLSPGGAPTHASLRNVAAGADQVELPPPLAKLWVECMLAQCEDQDPAWTSGVGAVAAVQRRRVLLSWQQQLEEEGHGHASFNGGGELTSGPSRDPGCSLLGTSPPPLPPRTRSTVL
jgi:hypothetical protein